MRDLGDARVVEACGGQMTSIRPLRDRASIGLVGMALAALTAAAITAYAYWPGLMTWDSVRQYDQALSGDIDDWHPPVMEWIWRQFLPVHKGPIPMLLLELALYWGGLVLLAGALWRQDRHRLAGALLACGLLPIGLALTGEILKDVLLAGTLLVTAGFVARNERGVTHTLIAVALLLFAAMLRFNAFTACLPLLIVLLPETWRTSWPRLALATVVGTALLMAAMPVANRLIGAKPSGVELSLIIFDLGGITKFSGSSAFPAEIRVDNPVEANARCYDPEKWDSYAYWVDVECPLGFSAWSAEVASRGVKPYPYWVSQIAAHPLAYAEHRLLHFAINTRLLPLSDSVERPVQAEGPPNDWGFHVTDNPVLRAIDGLAVLSAHTPLGWPIVWIAIALGVVVAAWGRNVARLALPLALSSLFYGSGYLVFSVASELRYHLWTELAALLALVLIAGDLRDIPRRRLLWAFGPTGLVALIGIMARL